MAERDRLKQKSHLFREAVAGITTFFTMSYIIFVNPLILAGSGTGMSFDGVLTATVILSFSMTLLMGLYAKLPYAVAPGMGINAFFAYSIVLGQKVPWQTALGMVFWAGILFLVISLTPLREHIARIIPSNLRVAAATGIGILLSFIGLKNMGLITSDPITFVKFAGVGPTSLLSLAGLFISIFLLWKKNPFSFLAGIFCVTVAAFLFGYIKPPEKIVSLPNFSSVFLQLDPWDALQMGLLPAIAAILFTDLFDSLSTFVGVSHACGLLDSTGQPKNLKQGLVVDAVATLGAGLLGTSSGTAYIESSAGIESGGRTGLTSVFTAICFLPFLFIAPIASVVPTYATAPVLLLVGALLFRTAGPLSTAKLEDAFPAYLTIILIPLTFSITQGILWGFISHVLCYVLVGRRKELSVTLWLLAAISVGLISIESVSTLSGEQNLGPTLSNQPL